MNQKIIDQFRSGAPMRMPKSHLLLLTTIGRRTGRPHTVPMMFVRIADETGDHIVVAGSNSGAASDPDWVRNLRENPDVTVELGDDSPDAGPSPAHATVVDDETRAAWWPQVTAANPMWAQHQEGLARAIPLIDITR